MKRILIALILAALPIVAYANCTTHTIMRPGGSILICQTCCNSLGCTTMCR